MHLATESDEKCVLVFVPIRGRVLAELVRCYEVLIVVIGNCDILAMQEVKDVCT